MVGTNRLGQVQACPGNTKGVGVLPKRLEIKAGDRFGRLTIIRELSKYKQKRYFLCRCECGNTRRVRLVAMRAGEIKSCGCLRDEQNRVAGYKHGLHGSGPYWSWRDMKQRCFNLNNVSYKYYGGRGITICEEWLEYENFYAWAIENGHKSGLTIERINNNGNYEPKNCCWIPAQKQSENTRRSKYISYQGETKILKHWAKATGIRYSVLQARFANGWSTEKALNTPVRKQVARCK